MTDATAWPVNDTGLPDDPTQTLIEAIGIIQACALAQPLAAEGRAEWGVFYMPTAALDHAVKLLIGLIPASETRK